ncbi:type I-B CRISPR-associated protein Cas7/Cst2/DevR [uncultured Clostridium sp.]|uniref:type I-B CRISPR-associated protein Cas7/Cst2/DevR n=2 Tax=Clostridium TaxID=1485 RepID=UPI002729B558|nr:type I-B CRISPR-associated protein Cas7/Cst2/DevR [uncultured Clostridium sp.]
MNKKALTLTVIANMTSNYSEGLGNIASVQKVFKNGKVYTMRSRESLKNAIMVQSGMYDDLKTEVDKKTTQKMVNKELNASNCRALEGGYMNTLEVTNIRKSSFYLTDAIACDRFVNETRFHNNLYLATNVAKSKGINIEANLKDSGLMPYQYEYDKSLKIYSITIDLEMIGKDENFEHEENYREASSEEKADRVNSLLNAIENLSLTVKGNLDNAEPVFIVGGLSDRKTHYFENVVKVEEGKLILSEDLQDKIKKGFYVGLLEGRTLRNESEVKEKLAPISISKFFDNVRNEVNVYFGVE